MGKLKKTKLYDQLVSGDLEKKINGIASIAKKMGRSEFETYLETNELPAIKLSKEELSLLSGGVWDWLRDFAYAAGKFVREHPKHYR